MVTFQIGELFNRYVGLSTDTKPDSGIPNGSTFVEMDTQNLWYFDAENKTWHKCTATR